MLKIIQITLSAFLVFLTASASAWGANLQISALSAPPYTLSTPKGTSGAAVDIVSIAAQHTGISVDFSISNWARAFDSAITGNVDAILPTLQTPDRQPHLLYPEAPLFDFRMIVLSRQSAKINWTGNVYDLDKNLVFGRLRGAKVHPKLDALLDSGQVYVEERSSLEHLIIGLANERLDIFAGEELMTLYAAQLSGLRPMLEAHSPELGTVPVYLAFSRKSKNLSLMQPLTQEIERLRGSKTLQAIMADYIEAE